MIKNYKHFQKQILNEAKKYKTPVAVQFELTSRCNLDCKMCYVHNADSNKMKSKELSAEQWKIIMEDAYNAGMMFATLTGGECLLRDDFKELYLFLLYKGVKVNVLSNGTLIDDTFVEFFSLYKPASIQITIYGSTEQAYRNVTGHYGLEKAISACEKLREKGIAVVVNVTCSSYMDEDYISTLNYIRQHGFFPKYSELLLFPKRDDSGNVSHFLSPDRIFELSLQRQKMVSAVSTFCNLPKIGGSYCGEPVKGTKCTAGNCLAFISWEGKMYPCTNLIGLGGISLLDMPYDEAWKRTVELASQIVQPTECEGCAYDKACPKCIVHRTADLYSGHCNPDVCELTKRLVAAGVKKLDTPQEADEDEFEH